MKKFVLFLLVASLLLSGTSLALAAKGGIKGKPQILPARPSGTQTETPPLGKAKGWQKFELQGEITVALSGGSFTVKMKSGGKSIRRYHKRGEEITITVDGATKYKPKKFKSDPASVLKVGRRVKVRGRFDQDQYKATMVVVRGLKSL